MKTEMIAGGASLAPSRCSLPDVAMPARSSPACLCTALSTAARNTRKRMFWCGVFPGLSRFGPSSSGESAVIGHRPVAVLSRAVDAGKRLLVQQRLQAVAQRDAPQRRHHEQVVVDGEIGLLEIRRHLELARRDFVVTSRQSARRACTARTRLRRCSLNALRNAAEVVIFELLPARGRSAEKGAAAHHEIGTQREVRAVDEEVFLLGAERREDALHALVAEELEQLDRFLRERHRSCGAAASSHRALRRCSR